MFDLSHPFFRPLWLRVVLSTGLSAWALVEFATGAPFWGVMVGAMAVWSIWGFFLSRSPAEAEEGDDGDSD
ncbi:MAG: DUF3329 domain-containing protein [Paracoccaceae bacterium]|nr:DUF3329 domain-containing protein [Paracoccaceae bacterium]